MTATIVRIMIEGKQEDDITLIGKLAIYNGNVTAENTIRKLGRNFDSIEKVSVYDQENKLLATVSCSQLNWHMTINKGKNNQQLTEHPRSQTLNSTAKKEKFSPKPNEKISDKHRDFGPDIYSLSNFILTELGVKPKQESNNSSIKKQLDTLLAANQALIDEIAALKAQANK